MKKIIYFFVIGLMSLITMSCEDHLIYDAENNFLPIMYDAKSPENMEDEVSSLLILGVEGLVFDQIEKSDWKIITKESSGFIGDKPLEIVGSPFILEEKGAELLEIRTNYESIPITFGNTTVTYEYMGKPVELMPSENLNVSVIIEELSRQESPFFAQYGNIVYKLRVGVVTVKIHKQRFLVCSDETAIDKLLASFYGDATDTGSTDSSETE